MMELNIFLQRRVPKNIQDLQSWKECSLQQQLNELKKELNKSKTDVELDMENIIRGLQQQTSFLKEQLKTIQIANRLLQQKSEDSEKYLSAYSSIKIELSSSRSMIKKFKEECEHLRKENIRLKKESKTQNNKKENSGKPQTFHLRVPSETESLSFSVYSKE